MRFFFKLWFLILRRATSIYFFLSLCVCVRQSECSEGFPSKWNENIVFEGRDRWLIHDLVGGGWKLQREANAYLKNVNFDREDDNLQLNKFLLLIWRRRKAFFWEVKMKVFRWQRWYNHNLQFTINKNLFTLQLNKFLLLIWWRKKITFYSKKVKWKYFILTNGLEKIIICDILWLWSIKIYLLYN